MLYHKDVFLPKRVINQCPNHKRIRLTYSEHAKQAAQSDRYGQLTLPVEAFPNQFNIVEVETRERNGQPVMPGKIVFRHHYNDSLDLVIVIVPIQMDLWHVKTVCANEKSDNHATLKGSVYVQPPKGYKKVK